MAVKKKKTKRTGVGINKTTGRLKKGFKYGKNGRVVKAKAATKAKAKKRTAVGINKTTGRLKKGFKYGKNGRVIKVKKK